MITNTSLNPGFLLHKIGAMMEHVSDRVLFDQFGIGFSQFKILFALGHRDGSIQQKEIALFLGQTEASISRQIKLLAKVDLISVTKGMDDKKKHLIALTGKGEKLANDAFMALNTHYAPVLSNLSASEQADLAKKLSIVHSSLEINCASVFSANG